MANQVLTLDVTEPAVVAATEAEARLYRRYGLQPRHHTLSIPGGDLKMRITEMGTGLPLLVVPGNTGDVFPLIPLFAYIKDRRIIAINRPGGGLSEGFDHTEVNIRSFAVQTILAVMDAFGWASADILAHSMGAHWSLWTAMDSPGRVNSLTLMGNPGNVMKGKPPLLIRVMMYWPLNKLLAKLVIGANGDMRPGMLRAMGSTTKTIDALPKEFGECYYYFKRLPHYLISLTSMLKNAAPNITAQQLAMVKQPAQLLLGDRDTFASVKIGKSITGAMPNCRLHIIKEGSHLPWLEDAAGCGRLINDFFTGLAQPTFVNNS